MSDNLSQSSNTENSHHNSKEIRLIKKENQKLQKELKIKNETITSLINQNFSELKILQEKHLQIIDTLTKKYDDNINEIIKKYNIFKSCLQKKWKDTVSMYFKINNEKNILLTNYNDNLLKKNTELQQEIDEKNNEIDKIIKEKNIIHQKNIDFDEQNMEITKYLAIFEKRYEENIILLEETTNEKTNCEKKNSDLILINNKLENDLQMSNKDLKKNENLCIQLNDELAILRQSQKEIQNKYTLLLNDNTMKQLTIDEKILEILALNSKNSELEKKISSLDVNNKNINIELADIISKSHDQHIELTLIQKTLQEYKIENNTLNEDKKYYTNELNTAKDKLKEIESSLLNKIKQIQDDNTKDKNTYLNHYNNNLSEITSDYERKIQKLKSDFNATNLESETQINGLMNYLKTLSDSQYLVLNNLEKIKAHNEKLQYEVDNFDKKTATIDNNYNKEINDLKTNCEYEKNSLIESYNDTIKRSQELNEALQFRLNQTIEALSLSRTTISTLKEENQQLERKLEKKELDDNSYQAKYEQLKYDNMTLDNKLDRSIELNNNLNNKMKQYEIQIKQLQSKYNHLLSLTKKGLENSIS